MSSSRLKLALACICAGPLWAAACPATSGSSVSTLSCTVSVTSGDRIVMASVNGLTTSTFSSSPSATWTTRATVIQSSLYLALADAVAPSTGIMTLTVTWSSPDVNVALLGYDLGPIGSIDGFAGTAHGPSGAGWCTASNPCSASITTAGSSDTAIAMIGTISQVGPTAVGFTKIESENTSLSAMSEKTGVTPGTLTATFNTLTGSGSQYYIVLVAYLPAGGGASACGGLALMGVGC